MTEAPQIQAVLSSRNVSGREAESLISRFLITQKKYLSSTDVEEVVPSNSDEEYFDMEDNNAGGTFEEIQSRLEGIVRSLPRSSLEVEHASHFPMGESHHREDVDLKTRKKMKKEDTRVKKLSKKKRKQDEDSISVRKKIKREE